MADIFSYDRNVQKAIQALARGTNPTPSPTYRVRESLLLTLIYQKNKRG